MKNTIIFALLIGMIALGCLRIESKGGASPSPQLIYVNVTPSPSVIVTVVTTVIPTVTEKVIYATPTPKPTLPPKKGGIQDLGVRQEFVMLDISPAANADYHHNPFLLRNSIGKNFYPGLKEGTIEHAGVPFAILPDYQSAGKWSAITTASEDFYSVAFPANRQRLSEIKLLAMGAFKKGDRRVLGEIRINYEDGIVEAQQVISNENVWNYELDANNPMPAGKVAWESNEGGENQTLGLLAINSTRPLEKIGTLVIKKTNTGDAGFSIFAATGIKRFKGYKIIHTQTEFQTEVYSRYLITTLPAGVTINYRDEGGKRFYRSNGTFISPVFDGGTILVNWSSIGWDIDMPGPTRMKLLARLGDTPEVAGRWTEWFEVPNGGAVSGGRYLQWKAELATSDPYVTPLLKEIRIAYENPVP